MEQSTLDTAMDTTTPAPAEESPAATGEIAVDDAATTSQAEAENATSETATDKTATETTVGVEGATAETSADSQDGDDNSNVYVPQPELSESLAMTESVEESDRREVEGGRAYEIGFITRADDADATRKTIESARALIEEAGGAIDKISVTEVRRLAYPIKRQIEGVYTFVNTRFAQSHLSEIDRFFKLEESVLRHMILRVEM